MGGRDGASQKFLDARNFFKIFFDARNFNSHFTVRRGISLSARRPKENVRIKK